MKICQRMAVDSPFDFVFPEFDFAILGVPKCGSTMLRNVLSAGQQRLRPVPRAEALQYQTRLAVIRHPEARLLSAWNSKWREIPWETFWKHVQSNPQFDIHTTPYSLLLRDDPTHVVRLEAIESWWQTYYSMYPLLFPSKPKLINVNDKPLPHPPGERYSNEIQKLYAADLEMWLTAGPAIPR